jgi:excisionase family DNA binding protein
VLRQAADAAGRETALRDGLSPLLTVRDAARILATSTRAIYAMVEANPPEIPHIRIGARRIRFTEEQLRDYVARCEHGGTA